MKSGREGNREGSLKRVKESGIEHLGRRGGDDDTVPLPVQNEFTDPPNDSLLLAADLVERVAIELKSLKVEFNLGRDHRQEAIIVRHGARPAADEADSCFDRFTHNTASVGSRLESRVLSLELTQDARVKTPDRFPLFLRLILL